MLASDILLCTQQDRLSAILTAGSSSLIRGGFLVSLLTTSLSGGFVGEYVLVTCLDLYRSVRVRDCGSEGARSLVRAKKDEDGQIATLTACADTRDGAEGSGDCISNICWWMPVPLIT